MSYLYCVEISSAVIFVVGLALVAATLLVVGRNLIKYHYLYKRSYLSMLDAQIEFEKQGAMNGKTS